MCQAERQRMRCLVRRICRGRCAQRRMHCIAMLAAAAAAVRAMRLHQRIFILGLWHACKP